MKVASPNPPEKSWQNILQKFTVCVPQSKESHTGLEVNIDHFNFLLNILWGLKYVDDEVQKKDAVDGEEKHASTAAVWVLNEKVRRVSPLGCYYADFAVERERERERERESCLQPAGLL